jgi:hypothetical protein
MTDSLDFGPSETERPREARPTPDTTPKVPISRQIACVERELALRGRVYAGLVRAGKMKHETAQLEIESMEAVLATLQAVRSLFSKNS